MNYKLNTVDVIGITGLIMFLSFFWYSVLAATLGAANRLTPALVVVLVVITLFSVWLWYAFNYKRFSN